MCKKTRHQIPYEWSVYVGIISVIKKLWRSCVSSSDRKEIWKIRRHLKLIQSVCHIERILHFHIFLLKGDWGLHLVSWPIHLFLIFKAGLKFISFVLSCVMLPIRKCRLHFAAYESKKMHCYKSLHEFWYNVDWQELKSESYKVNVSQSKWCSQRLWKGSLYFNKYFLLLVGL